MKDTSFCHKLRLPSIPNLVQDRPLVMGIINCTPDSFYEGSRSAGSDESLRMASQMIEEGVDILDIGAYSSRPGSDAVSRDEELRRLLPSIESIRKEFSDMILSIDTFRSEVAEAALERGVSIINDISAGDLDERMPNTVSKFKASYIMMHMRGNPRTMMDNTDYKDLIAEIIEYFSLRIARAKEKGVKNLIIDPGFGFSKTLKQNYELLSKLDQFKEVAYPLMIGISRKSMVYKLLGKKAEEILSATSALHMMALTKGADILRVHDVREARELIELSKELVVWKHEDFEA